MTISVRSIPFAVALALSAIASSCRDSPAPLRGVVTEHCDEHARDLERLAAHYLQTGEFAPWPNLLLDDGRHAVWSRTRFCARARRGYDLHGELGALVDEFVAATTRFAIAARDVDRAPAPVNARRDAARHLDHMIEIAERINRYPLE